MRLLEIIKYNYHLKISDLPPITDVNFYFAFTGFFFFTDRIGNSGLFQPYTLAIESLTNKVGL